MSDKTSTTVWEERVIALEAEKKERDALMATQAETITAQSAKVAGLSATVAALNAAEQTRTVAAADAYISQIKAEACAAGSPISEDDVAKVAEQFAASNAELAKVLGGAFLGRSKALGAGAVGGSSSVTVSLGVTDKEQEDHDAEMADFRRRHNIKQEA